MSGSTKIDRNARVSNVTFFEGNVGFFSNGQRWAYFATRGRIYPNLDGDPVHESADGSFCLKDCGTLGEMLAYANLLGANVTPVRT
ncbi:MAG: hypothetical protein ACOY6K_10035 [Pseudomonadota bacterium]